MTDAFATADDVLRQAIQGISDLILVPGLINLDFADVKTIMSGMGLAMMGTGVAEGPDRAMEAARRAISSPLLEGASVNGARGVIINVTGGPDLSLVEVQRGVVHRPGGGRRGRQHHLRRGRRSGAEGQGQDHGDRDRLRRAVRLARPAPSTAQTPVDMTPYTESRACAPTPCAGASAAGGVDGCRSRGARCSTCRSRPDGRIGIVPVAAAAAVSPADAPAPRRRCRGRRAARECRRRDCRRSRLRPQLDVRRAGVPAAAGGLTARLEPSTVRRRPASAVVE